MRYLRIWYQLSVSRFWIERLLTEKLKVVTLVFLVLLAGANTGHGESHADKRTGSVIFPRMDSPVRVFALNDTVKLAQGQLINLIRARDRNAFWLLCDERGDKTVISYRFRFTNDPFADREYRVTGNYDRGIYLKLPSEYALFRGKTDEYQYVDGDKYFKILVPVDPPPEISEWNLAPRMAHFGIPNYINWAEPTYLVKPYAYWTEREMSALGMIRDCKQFQYGYEFWFEKPDLRLVKEAVLAPKTVENSHGKEDVSCDYGQAETLKTVEYTYGEDNESRFPTLVSVRSYGYLTAKLEFRLIQGYWMMAQGNVYSYSVDGETFSYRISTADIMIEK